MLARQVISQLELRRAVLDRDKAIDIQRSFDDKRRASDAQYKVLFDAIDAGLHHRNEVRRRAAVDYRFIEINPAFERHTGLVQAHGR